MKTIKLSLNAIAAMCCLMLFMTGCQDDTVENELEPTMPGESETAQSQIPKDIQQLLHNSLNNPTLDFNSNSARTANSNIVYDLTITVFEADASGSAAEALGEIEGTLKLQKLDDTLGVTPLEGSFEYIDERGQQQGRRVAGVITGSTTNIAINNFPIIEDRAFFSGSFDLGEDFAVEDIVFERLSDDPKFVIKVEGNFLRGPVPVPSYELTITIPTDTNEFFTINGTLALAPPSGNSSNSLEGTFTFINDSGEEVVVNTGAAPALGSDADEGDLMVVLDFEDIPPVNDVITFDVADLAFEPGEGLDTFIETGESLFGFGGSLENITFVGRLIEDPS